MSVALCLAYKQTYTRTFLHTAQTELRPAQALLDFSDHIRPKDTETGVKKWEKSQIERISNENVKREQGRAMLEFKLD